MPHTHEVDGEIPIVRPRDNELTETTENYLKRILWLSKTKHYAKVTEVADLMGRSLSSTTEAMKRLKDQGFINYERYGHISLTETGRSIASRVNTAYTVIGSFLELIGLDKQAAHEDACSMEHAVATRTVELLERFVEFMYGDPVNVAVMAKFLQTTKEDNELVEEEDTA